MHISLRVAVVEIAVMFLIGLGAVAISIADHETGEASMWGNPWTYVAVVAFALAGVLILGVWRMARHDKEDREDGRGGAGAGGIGVFDSRGVNVHDNLIRSRKPFVEVHRSEDVNVARNIGVEPGSPGGRRRSSERRSWLFGEMPWKKNKNIESQEGEATEGGPTDQDEGESP